ncbi:FimD/PapC C-terminal domain-containing protein, partial [Providencia huaxiensis]
DDSDINTGIVGSNGQLYMSGLPDSGRIRIQWGGKAGQCTVNYSALEKIAVTADSPVRTLNTQCQ